MWKRGYTQVTRKALRSDRLYSRKILLVVDLGFMTLLTSQVTSVAFYIEREKFEQFCSEALISA